MTAAAEIVAAKLALHSMQLEEWGCDESWRSAVPKATGPRTPTARSKTDLPLSKERPWVVQPGLFEFAHNWHFPGPSDLANLAPKYAIELSAQGVRNEDGTKITVGTAAFVEYFFQQDTVGADDEPLSVFDASILVPERSGELATTLAASYAIPDVDGLELTDSAFDSLAYDLRPDVWFLHLGPTRSGTRMHRDPDGTSPINVVTHGRKRWAIMAPTATIDLATREEPPEGTEWTIMEWFLHEWPRIRAQAKALNIETFDFEQGVGEMVVLPPGWWHAVLNIESSVAVSHNILRRSEVRN